MKTQHAILTVLAAVLITAFTLIKSYTIKGSVTDTNGASITGAIVSVKGSEKVSTTDANGYFEINVPSLNVTINIAAAGFVTKEIRLKDQRHLHIKLSTSTTVLQELKLSPLEDRVYERQTVSRTAMAKSKEVAPGVSIIEYFGNRKNEEWRYNNDFNREGYDNIEENKFLQTLDNPLSTFSIDVDAASLAMVRRIINSGTLPPAGAVRIEEMINYFKYKYPLN